MNHNGDQSATQILRHIPHYSLGYKYAQLQTLTLSFIMNKLLDHIRGFGSNSMLGPGVDIMFDFIQHIEFPKLSNSIN